MEVLVVHDPQEIDTVTSSRIISESFRRSGSTVDLQDLSKKPVANVEKYDVVILGGSISFGKLSYRLHRFIKRYARSILKTKSYLFLCSYYEDDRFQKIAKKYIPLKLLHHSFTVNPGLNIQERDMGTISRLKYRVFEKRKNKKKYDINRMRSWASFISQDQL